MRHQAFKPIALMLSTFLLTAAPVQAGPVEYKDVVSSASVFGQSGRPSVDLRLRAFTQQQGKSASQSATPSQDTKSAGPSGATAPADTGSNVSLTGAEVAPQQPTTTVETIQVGEVDGTICDCGEILRPGGGFPLWPLLGLAGIPLFFIPGDEAPPEFLPTPPPPPPPPPDVIPEPATLLLFGTGLLAVGAGARRRRARQAKLLNAREV